MNTKLNDTPVEYYSTGVFNMKIANAIIVCHNHPSGNLQPCESDITLTKKVKESASIMDVQLLDHLIIVPEGKYYSMADEGVI